MPAAPAVIGFRPGVPEQVDRARVRRGRAAGAARPPRLRGRRRLERDRPVLARARRAARDRRRRGGRALPARGRPDDTARAAGDVRPADPLPAPAPPGRGRARRRRLLRGVHVLAAGDRPGSERDRAARAALSAAAVPADVAGAGARRRGTAQRRHGEHRHPRSSRSRTSTCRWRGPSARGALAPRGHRRGRRSLPRKGMVEGVFDALAHRAALRARSGAAAVAGRRGRAGRAGSRSTGCGTLDGEWSAFELDLAELFEQVPERILYRDVITYPPLREDLAFVVAERRARRRLDRARRARRRARSCARCGS